MDPISRLTPRKQTMDSATAKPVATDELPRMGSEYSDARSYLARSPQATSLPEQRKKPKTEPQHGSNDSDFGMPDQWPE